MRLAWLLGLSVWLLLPLPGWGATYYVAQTGCTGGCSDSHPCSGAGGKNAQNPAYARATMNGGVACLASGDTLVIGSGTYNECLGDTTAPVIPSGRNAAERTTVRVASGATVLQTATGGCSGGGGLIEIDTHSFIVFDGHNGSGIGWVIDAMINSSTVNSFGIGMVGTFLRFKDLEVKRARTPIKVEGPGSNEFLGLHVHLAGTPVCRSPTGCHGIYVSSSNNLFDRVHSHHNNCYGITISVEGGTATGNTVRNSTFHHNGCGQLGQGGNLWVNNVFYNNAGPEGGALNTPSPIINNTFYNNGLYGPWPTGGASQVVKNNISVGHTYDILEDRPVNASHNVCSATGVSGTMGCTMVGSAAGLFVDPGGADFRLRPGAPAVEAGTCLGGDAATDHDGVVRPQQTQCDIGAYELSAGAPGALALAFVQQPSTTQAGVVITPAVTVRVVDQSGNPVSSTALVTLALGANPGSSALGGDHTQQVAGTTPATFADLTLNNAGAGYTLVASSPGLHAATSASFTIAGTETQTAPTQVLMIHAEAGSHVP